MNLVPLRRSSFSPTFLPLVSVLIGVLLTVLATVALGQSTGVRSPDNVCGAVSPASTIDFRDWTTPRCWPGGAADSGTGFQSRVNAKGATAWWYCPERKDAAGPITRYRLTWVAGTWAAISEGRVKPDTPISDPVLLDVWCPYAQEMARGVPLVTPEPLGGPWVVATGAVYSVKNGQLDKIVATVSRGGSCDCSVQIKIGPATYCKVALGYAQCRKTP